MSWIRIVPYEAAEGRLRKLYDRIRGPDTRIDNIMLVHGLRPHSLEGHMTLYKHVLHHSANRVPRWLLETIGVYVSSLNRCDYCVAHHAAGLARLLDDVGRAVKIRRALEADAPETVFSGRDLAALGYARALTLAPAEIADDTIAALRDTGFDDGEILEINQVVAYFAYANRTVLGLGVTTEGETLGLSPDALDDPDDWSHR